MKLLLVPFFLCGMFAGYSIRSAWDDGSGHGLANQYPLLLMPAAIALCIYLVIRRSALRARRSGAERIDGWSTSAWMCAPPLTFLAGIPGGIFYLEVAHFLAGERG